MAEVGKAVQGVQGGLRDVGHVVAQDTEHEANLYRRR